MKRGMMTAALTLGLTAGMGLFAAPAMAQTTDWTGPYFGVGAGYAWLNEDDGETLQFDTNRDGSFDDMVLTGGGANAFSPGFCSGAAIGNAPAAGCSSTDGEGSFSLRAGYDWQMGSWVFGGLGEITKAELRQSVTGFSTTPAAYVFNRELDYTVAARGRGGYAMNDILIYGTAGVLYSDIDHSFNTTNGANSFTPNDPDGSWGYQIGAGVEKKFGGNFTLGAEYLYSSLEDDEYVVAVGPGTAGPTNPFLIVDPTGTDMRRSDDDFNFGTLTLTASLHY